MDITISNQVYHLSIPQETADRRDALCPSKGSFACSRKCPVYLKLCVRHNISCNEALDRYPDCCISLLEDARSE